MLIQGIVFFVILSILVLIHEIGHFLMAKIFNVRIDEFGFGLPPKIFGKKIGETVYSFNALPIGGFVKLFGEEGEDNKSSAVSHQSSEIKRAFYAKPTWQRALILIAGVAMNFLLALATISFLFTQGVFVPARRVHIENVADNSPAAQANLKSNDIIAAFNDIRITKSEELIAKNKENLDKDVKLTIQRGVDFSYSVKEDSCPNCETLIVTVRPRSDAPQGQGPLGITISNFEERRYPWHQAIGLGVIEELKRSWLLLSTLGVALWKFATLQPVNVDVGGPIAIARVTAETIKYGWRAVLELLGFLSLNLALFNLLPIPALDGGRLLFVAIEGIFKRKINTRYERALHQIVMVCLLALLVLISINDISKWYLGKLP